MSKQLKLVDIKNENKIYNEKKKVELSDKYFVYIYPHFSPIKITELINEILTDPQRAKEVGIDFDKINITDWGLFNIIYKFADLGIPSEIKKKVQAFSEIMNSEYWTKIIEAFPVESINKFKESLDIISANIEQLAKKNQVENVLADKNELNQQSELK